MLSDLDEGCGARGRHGEGSRFGVVDSAAVDRRARDPMSKELWLRGHRRAWRSYPTLKVRKDSGEEIPLVQGKEQWLHFAGAAVKRYPTPKVRETQVRQ